MRVSLLFAVPFALSALACAGAGDKISDSGTNDSDGDAWFEPDVLCTDGAVEFSADAYGDITAIQVEAYSGEELVETVDLVDRGDGDWFATSERSATYDACMDGSSSYFLFTATTGSGAEIEEGI